MSAPNDILILADRGPQALHPLTEFAPPPLLPIGGKPVLQHVLECVSTETDARVTIVVANGDARTPQWIDEHGFPRLTITVTDQAAPVLEQAMVVLRGDMAPRPESIRRLLKGEGDNEPGAWRLPAGALTPTWRQTAMLADNDDALLPNPRAYWRMSLAAARGEIAGMRLAGWVADDGVRLGRDARILTRRAAGQHVLVGDNVFVDKHVLLGDNVVVGDGCFIAKGAALSDTVVLPGSYIGPNLNLANALVCGAWLWRMDSDEMVLVEDSTVLGRLAA